MDGIGPELKPRPMDQAQQASYPLTARWPTLLLAPPGTPPLADIRQPSPLTPRTRRLSMLHSSGFPHASAGQRTSALRAINKTAGAHDSDRVMFARACLGQLQRATCEGVPVDGYSLWSAQDSF